MGSVIYFSLPTPSGNINPIDQGSCLQSWRFCGRSMKMKEAEPGVAKPFQIFSSPFLSQDRQLRGYQGSCAQHLPPVVTSDSYSGFSSTRCLFTNLLFVCCLFVCFSRSFVRCFFFLCLTCLFVYLFLFLSFIFYFMHLASWGVAAMAVCVLLSILVPTYQSVIKQFSFN